MTCAMHRGHDFNDFSGREHRPYLDQCSDRKRDRIRRRYTLGVRPLVGVRVVVQVHRLNGLFVGELEYQHG